MPESNYVHLVDSHPARREAVGKRLSEHGLHAEPYRSLAQLHKERPLPNGSRGRRYPQQGVLLICDGEGLEFDPLIAKLHHHSCYIPVLAYSDHLPRTRHVVAAILSGLWDYFVLPDDYDRLAYSVEKNLRRSEEVVREKRQVEDAQKLISLLTRRELLILEKSAEGGSNKSIGIDLEISPRTVEVHRRNMMAKLNASNIGEAAHVFFAARGRW